MPCVEDAITSNELHKTTLYRCEKNITVNGVRKVPNPSNALPPCSAKIIDITVV